MGQVKDTPIDKWDFSYRVNLRGPVLLAKAFLPEMIRRDRGVFVCVSSSGAAPYMGAYEVFKTAQGELASTIAAEVEGTGVYAFTIGPGIVRTPGFVEGGGQVAAFMGKSLEELLEMNKNFEISAEAAGTGFAASVALASKYHGQETSSIQVLREIGITVAEEEKETTDEQPRKPTPMQLSTDKSTNDIFASVLKNYSEQSDGWKKRNLFERQWISRDFKKNTGISIDEMNNELNTLHESVKNKKQTPELAKKLKVLAGYYAHQQDQLRGFEKNPDKLKENLSIIDGWINDIKTLLDRLS